MSKGRAPIRYAVVGLGHIAQVAVLPAFRHAQRNSRLVALVSDDRTKRREVGKKYRVERTYGYDEYEACLEGVDAVYIALPNSLHAEYTVRAARAGDPRPRRGRGRPRPWGEADGGDRGRMRGDDPRLPRGPRQADDRLSPAL